VITSDAADPQSGAFTATFTFSEDVTGFELADIAVGNGVASNFQTTSASIYTATVTPTADGEVTVDVAADKAADAASNGNNAATQLSVANDETKPAVTITSDANDPQSGAFTATFTFSEAVTGFELADITVGNGAASNFQATSTSVYTATITPSADGAVTVDVGAGIATDAATNTNTAAAQVSVTNDETKPAVTITSDANNPQSGAFTATFTFSEAVTGFIIDDITVGNGAASNFQATSASVYTATITPSADGAVTVDVVADKANDAAGNGNTAASQLSVTNDETAPTVVITSDAADPQSGAFTATFTFSEDVTGFELADIAVGNGAASNFQTTSAAVYTATITPSADGAVTVDVGAGIATDAATNTNTAASQLSVTNDETAPTVVITSDAADPQSGAFTATFTFSEDVTGFELEDITVGNGAASNFQATSTSVYTATITPSADGAVTIDVAADVATDAATNTNTAATQVSVTNDETKPTVVISTDATNPLSGAFTATFTFSEAVTGFELADIAVGNGAASNFQATSTSVYTATITPSADGAVTIDVAADVASDAASNGNTAATQLVVNTDGIKPEVLSISRKDGDQLNNTATDADFNVVFSEAVEGVDIADFVLALTGTANATINTLTAVDAKNYTVNVNGISGQGTIQLNTADDISVEDLAGNALTGSARGALYTINWIPTAITLSNSSIAELADIGTTVGDLNADDQDGADTHTFSLVAGEGDTDNASFSLAGGSIKSAEIFDFEAKASYSIRVKADDGNGGVFEQAISISVENVLETAISVTGETSFEQTVLGLTTSKTWTITNTGEKEVTVSVSNSNAAYIASESSLTIAKDASVELTISFTPLTEGTIEDVIMLSHEFGETTVGVTGIGELVTSIDTPQIDKEQVKLYPNPATDVLTIDLSDLNGKVLDLSVLDANGRPLFVKQGFKGSILKLDITMYENGLYLLRINDERSVVTKKVMIRK
jgi:hypothetical protein